MQSLADFGPWISRRSEHPEFLGRERLVRRHARDFTDLWRRQLDRREVGVNEHPSAAFLRIDAG